MIEIFLSIVLSFSLSIVIVSFLIKKFKRSKIGQNIRTIGPHWHIFKEGTPNMGGISIILSTFLTVIFLKKINLSILSILLFTSAFAVLGLLDDYYNIKRRDALGLKARHKFLVQLFLSFVFSLYVYKISGHTINVPFLKNCVDLGYFYIPLAILVLVATSNAVNLTDGIDGLAGGCIVVNMIWFLFVSLYTETPYLSVFISSIIGATLGFLWFNISPAKIFMGNVGSLFLGASLGCVSLFTKTEVFLLIVGMIFVIEALSVIIQVIYFQTTGKRIFKMSPIHHHFELSGWSESQIAVRFWILSILFAIIGWLFFEKWI